MTAAIPTGAAGFLARFDALRDSLPGDAGVRAAVAEAFRATGLPGAERGRPIEAWKYTSLRPLADARAATSSWLRDRRAKAKMAPNSTANGNNF